MKKLLQMILCCLCCVGFFCGCDSSTTDKEKTNSGNDNSENEKKENNKNPYELGKAFKFDDLEITVGEDFTFTTIDNEYSDHHNQEVIKIPVTVKNLKEETHGLNMFYYDFYGSQGTQLDSVSAFFSEDSVDFAGDLRTDASYTKYFYALYDGDGKYTIEFNNFSEKISIDFEVKKEQ